MAVNSSQPQAPAGASLPPVPPPAGKTAQININFCKNPRCANFGVPADITKYARKADAASAAKPGSAYRLAGVGKNRPALKCLLCGETFTIKSNQAVLQELWRYWRYLHPLKLPCCPNKFCFNAYVPIPDRTAYYRYGTTAAGTPRYQCRFCGATVTHGGRALKKQRITHLNKTILLALTNKVVLSRITKITGINFVTLYGKIDFLHRQCLSFAAAKESQLPKLEIPRLYISVDRQDYHINWNRRADRRNVVLHGMGSADNDSGYVFAMNVNFDPMMDPAKVEQNAAASNDSALPLPHRQYARLWLSYEYKESLKAAEAEKLRKAAKKAAGHKIRNLGDEIEDSYEAVGLREDTEVSDIKSKNQKLPDAKGMQVHEEYSLYGHFQFLSRLLPKVGKLRFFLDQDSGMRAACFGAFAQDIKAKRVDAFYVRIAKEMTVDKKRKLVGQGKARFNQAQKAFPSLAPEEVKAEMMKAEIANAAAIGKYDDRWCMHPLPDMREPDKAVSWLTNLGDPAVEYDEAHQAQLFLKASLRGIDNFFQRIRRGLNPLERALVTASKDRRAWHGYHPYNPALVGKLLDIYRVVHNFVEAGGDQRTPAMRLGLSDHVVTPEEIIYFTR